MVGQFTVGEDTRGLVVLSSVRKQAEQAVKSKPVSNQCSSMASASVPASRFLPWVPALMFLDDVLQTIRRNKLLLVMVSYHSNSTLKTEMPFIPVTPQDSQERSTGYKGR